MEVKLRNVESSIREVSLISIAIAKLLISFYPSVKQEIEMKSKRFTEELIGIFKAGPSRIADLCRMHGISDAIFYNWRSKYGGMEVSDAKRLKDLEVENRRLKQMLVD
ncbi:MAG: transposase IS3/IS911 family protein [uncultured bacterium]|nr:MAG: transposase IS3/IS911 family protein [uncultured bacterium]